MIHCDKPILIICAASSGSTLLSYLLDKHPDIAIGPETYILNKPGFYDFELLKKRINAWLEGGLLDDGEVGQPVFYFNRDAYGITAEDFASLTRSSRSLKQVIERFFGKYLDRRGKRIWGEKTGSNAYYLDKFLKLYPKARIIHLVRDGRDAVSSIKKRTGSFYHGAAHWLYNNTAALRFQFLPGYIRIRYEDLVRDPEKELISLCSRLKIDFSPEMLSHSTNVYWDQYATHNIHDSWNYKPSSKISTRAIGSYRTVLKEYEISAFRRLRLSAWGEKKLGKKSSVIFLMKVFGYTFSPTTTHSTLCDPRIYMDAFREYGKRMYRELKYSRQLWRPVTTIW